VLDDEADRVIEEVDDGVRLTVVVDEGVREMDLVADWEAVDVVADAVADEEVVAEGDAAALADSDPEMVMLPEPVRVMEGLMHTVSVVGVQPATSPTEHTEQVVQFAEPAASVKVPAAHPVHTALVTAPMTTLLYCPKVHSVHAVDSAVGAYCPAGHSVQAPEPAPETLPAKHGKQAAGRVAPGVAENRPAAHAVQVWEAVAPMLVEKLPATHWVQFGAPLPE